MGIRAVPVLIGRCHQIKSPVATEKYRYLGEALSVAPVDLKCHPSRDLASK